MIRVRRAPRMWRRFRAFLGGYFWLPCDICGERFAGYEKRGGYLLKIGANDSMTCPCCPGEWVNYEGHLTRIAHHIERGRLLVHFVAASSEWKGSPEPPFLGEAALTRSSPPVSRTSEPPT